MRSELDKILNELAQYIIYGEENVKKAYQKEKITPLDSNASDIHKVYKKFQQIEEKNYWSMYDDQIFYKQAKYMENFEDTYEPSQQYRSSYNPYRTDNTYTDFSFTDFRTYFSWRTKIRKRSI